MFKDLFDLRGALSGRASLTLTAIGLAIIVCFWQIAYMMHFANESLLPSPLSVVSGFGELWFKDFLFENMLYSLKLNFLGYIEAILFSIPVGLTLGLIPAVRGLFQKFFDAIRFVPIPAITGLIITLFGLGDNMKIQFLAIGIIVYLIPTTIQRVDEVSDVFLDTVRTLGATKWQMLRYVYIPSVLSQSIKDIQVLTAISWTYITVAEVINKTNGLGALASSAARMSQNNKVIAIMVIITLIGVLQDRIFNKLSVALFPWKYGNLH